MAKLKSGADTTGYVFLYDDLMQLGGVTNQPTPTAGVTLTAKLVVQGQSVDNLHNIPGR